MAESDAIRISWEEWKSSRAAKRDALRMAGLESSSRRKTSFSTSDLRLRKAFNGARVPSFQRLDAPRGTVVIYR